MDDATEATPPEPGAAEPGVGAAAEPEPTPDRTPEPSAPSGPAAETGEPRVDEVVRRLGELDDLPVSEHPAIFERVHGQLVDVLGELRPGAPGERLTGH